MHKRAAVLALTFFALPLFGQRVLFEIGSRDLQPARGTHVTAARASQGALVLWSADDGLRARRLDDAGAALDDAPLALDDAYGIVGSDGRDYYVVSTPAFSNAMHLTRIDAITGAATHIDAALPAGTPAALVWNGSAFLFAYADYDGTYAVLVDALGHVTSGVRQLGYGVPQVVTNHGHWLLAFNETIHQEPVPLAGAAHKSAASQRDGKLTLLHPDDFPPVGTSAAPHWRSYGDGAEVRAAVDEDGYAAAYARDGAIVVEHLDADAEPRGPNETIADAAKPVALAQLASAFLVLTDAGDALAFPRTGAPFRVATPAWLGGTDALLLALENGVLAAASDGDRVAHVATRDPLGWQHEQILSRARATHSAPRLIAAAGSVVAVWSETNAVETSLWIAPLGADGDPLTHGTRLAAARFLGAPAVTFDGENLFVVWTHNDPTSYIATAYGLHVSSAGVPLDAPLVLASDLRAFTPAAVTWNGREYVVAFDEPVYRFARDGRRNSVEHLTRFASVALASRNGRTLGVGSREQAWEGASPFFVVSFADHQGCCFESEYVASDTFGFATVAASPNLTVSVLPDTTGANWIARDFDTHRELARVPAALHPPHLAATASNAFLVAGAGTLTRFTDMGVQRVIPIPDANGEIAVAEAPDGAALVLYDGGSGMVVERIETRTPRRPSVRH
ncbi:MAG: hypothetical protein JO197_14235 [Acidobacteria bacterium]|nr:hypothetical protein [Acidobacteriota bacterium]MBV9478704.1 hypothetical protein [Acidobacteriota bacterium]